ncbi:putative ef hand domain-containing protein [Golovinomyces cichoracearum]|uniref:Putative ef hand domain-containing protein n=1 Tax=Golovinomyces cichoracearum TaxID=62708 RepID=A0A420HXM4_9PEZI|nr:putative ef hand domain-containing protein [Golovinomyces cichoracearum]
MSWLRSFPGSATASLIVNSRSTIIVLASFLAIYTTFKIVKSDFFVLEPLPRNGIHRSNAIRRRHRARTNSTVYENDDTNSQSDGLDPAEETRSAIFDQTFIDNDYTTESSAYHEEYGRSLPGTFESEGQNIVHLLFRVSEDDTKRNAYVHRGCACNCCGMVPIRGIRFRCANCADYDLCETCESQGVHIKTHVFYKIRVPTSSIGPKNMQPVFYSGDPDSVARQLPRDTIVRLSRETGFERSEIEAKWEQWTFMADTDWREDPHDIILAMDRKTFERCLVPSGNLKYEGPCLIIDRMFAFYDTNKDNLIGFSEFLHGLAFRKKKDKWKKIFEGYDIDGDGYVDRKDFLRLFRSYYVLYRAMHTEMLEGLLEQQMARSDTRRLVNSRQPLSSIFGQDGRFPPAPYLRTGEGKLSQANGDLEIIDGKGVIRESSRDHGNRQDVFKHEFLKRELTHEDGGFRAFGGSRSRPASTELPFSEEQLLSWIGSLEPTDFQMNREAMAVFNPFIRQHDSSAPAAATDLRPIPIFDDDDSYNYTDSENSLPPNPFRVTDEDPEALEDPRTRALAREARLQSRTQRDIYERWQRRHFYTEEEEGGKPPIYWREKYDIFSQNDFTGESSKNSIPEIHSRSSSKVHIAEDINKSDARPNPSTSSGDIPEQREKLEIPDIERDAGKEILYQVTQQAFNELLDPLFKQKEDIAIEAAYTKYEREKFRYLYTKHGSDEKSKPRENLKKYSTQISTPSTYGTIHKELNDKTELSDISQRKNISTLTLDQCSQPRNSQLQPSSDIETENFIKFYNDPGDLADTKPVPQNSTVLTGDMTLPIYRDPTMPQFRVNNLQQASGLPPYHNSLPNPSDNENSIETGRYSYEKGTLHHRPANPTPESEEQSKIDFDKKKGFNKISEEQDCVDGVPTSRLLRYQICDQAANEAEQRGGWGRLNFQEFEQAVKVEIYKEKTGKYITPRMDYLGSWIEFCIP